jgi:hypothetical protein
MTSRTAGYAIRMSGGVGGGDREVTPYPYIPFLKIRFNQDGIFFKSTPKPIKFG